MSSLAFLKMDFLKLCVDSVRNILPAGQIWSSRSLCDATSSRSVLYFCKLSENASKPTRASPKSAGYDLYSAVEITIPSKGKALVPTDIQVKIPENCYGRIAPRSGLAHKHFIDVGAGVIDEDYRGNVGVILFNFGENDFKVCKGDRIAQLICEKIEYPEIEEVQSLDETERGSNGFGSSGVRAM